MKKLYILPVTSTERSTHVTEKRKKMNQINTKEQVEKE